MGHGPARPFSAIAAAAAPQQHLLTRAQLHALGLSDAAIRRWARAGRVQRLGGGVFRVAGSAETWWQRAMATTLAGPVGTLLSHRAAAAALALRGFDPGPIEVTAPSWVRAHRPGVRTHESCALPDGDRTTVRGVPATTVTRTLIDLAAVAHPTKVGVALDDARRRRLTTLHAVERRLRELAAPGRPGIRAMRQLVGERQGALRGTTSFEDLVLGIVADFGLPEPVPQWRVVDGDLVAYLDFAYPEQMIAIEADSEAYHLDLHQFRYDRTRQNRLSLLGWRFLRFTDTHLVRERVAVAEQIGTALSAFPAGPLENRAASRGKRREDG